MLVVVWIQNQIQWATLMPVDPPILSLPLTALFFASYFPSFNPQHANYAHFYIFSDQFRPKIYAAVHVTAEIGSELSKGVALVDSRYEYISWIWMPLREKKLQSTVKAVADTLHKCIK